MWVYSRYRRPPSPPADSQDKGLQNKDLSVISPKRNEFDNESETSSRIGTPEIGFATLTLKGRVEPVSPRHGTDKIRDY